MKNKKIAIYDPYLETRGGGEKVCLAMAEVLSKDNTVHIISKQESSLKDLGHYFGLDLSRCKLVVIKRTNILLKIANKLHIPSRLMMLLNDRHDFNKLRRMKFDIFVNNCYKSNMPCPAAHGIYMCMFPQEFYNMSKYGRLKRFYHRCVDKLELAIYGSSSENLVLDTYKVITVNSSYTKDWTKKLWKVQDDRIDVLYPICDDMLEKSVNKEKIILNVGRFFANSGENHYKCQDKLIKTFLKLKELHKDEWELHFAGSVADDAASQKYYQKILKLADGHPIVFHGGTPFPDLKKLYSRSTIYWHATGWGSNENEHPEKQEHFGISTVEAMSAMSIPIVISSAGQKEVVSKGGGLLWSTEKELKELTVKTALHDNRKLASEARRMSRRFNKKAFSKRVLDLCKKLY